MITVSDISRELTNKKNKIGQLYAEIAEIRSTLVRTIYDLSQEAMRIDDSMTDIRCGIGEEFDGTRFAEIIGYRAYDRENTDLNGNKDLDDADRNKLKQIETLLERAIMFFEHNGPFEGERCFVGSPDLFKYFEQKFRAEVMGER